MRGMRGAMLGCVLIAVVSAPAVGFGQWLKLPTQGVPRNPDGTPNLKAPTPRLPDGKPDLLGHLARREPAPVCAWHRRVHRLRQRDWRVQAVARPWRRHAGRPAVPAGRESSGSTARRTTAATTRTCAACPTTRRGIGTCLTSAGSFTRRSCWRVLYEVNAHVPADPHRRTAAARGHEPELDGLFDLAVGGRHARRADRGLPRRAVGST